MGVLKVKYTKWGARDVGNEQGRVFYPLTADTERVRSVTT
jgi:hypothetical protein